MSHAPKRMAALPKNLWQQDADQARCRCMAERHRIDDLSAERKRDPEVQRKGKLNYLGVVGVRAA